MRFNAKRIDTVFFFFSFDFKFSKLFNVVKKQILLLIEFFKGHSQKFGHYESEVQTLSTEDLNKNSQYLHENSQ